MAVGWYGESTRVREMALRWISTSNTLVGVYTTFKFSQQSTIKMIHLNLTNVNLNMTLVKTFGLRFIQKRSLLTVFYFTSMHHITLEGPSHFEIEFGNSNIVKMITSLLWIWVYVSFTYSFVRKLFIQLYTER